jgi:hypothetical protein
MKSTAFCIYLLISLSSAWADIESYSYLGTVSKDRRSQLTTIDPKALLADDNISRVIVLPTLRWKLSGAGPAGEISRYKSEFLKSARLEDVSDQVATEVDRLKTFDDYPTPNEMVPLVNWSDIYFLLKNNDFVTFGEDHDWTYFRTHSLLGRFKKASEHGSPTH